MTGQAMNAKVDAPGSPTGVAVRDLSSIEECAAAEALISEVWGNPPDQPLFAAGALRALSLSGNQVLGALDTESGLLLGVTVAWLGRDEHGLHLHSHITGVAPGRQGRAVGFTLKQAQRSWALERGVEVVRWTFDPLLARNAHFNLAKLGAVADRYHVDLYGEMADGVNAGDESDRLEVRWDLRDERVVAAAAGRYDEPDVVGSARKGAVVILAERGDGSPREGPPPAGASVLLARVPGDVLALRARHPDLAREWRRAARATIGAAVEAGYEATGATRTGWYLLCSKTSRAPTTLPAPNKEGA